MPISTRRALVTTRLLEFLWEEWAQLGVSATTTRASPWCHDPEALLLLTLEVARADPRLYDEVLDWMVSNDPLLSTRRLKTLCIDDVDRRLVGAAVEYSARARRPTPQARSNGDQPDLEPLFRDGVQAVREPDSAFAGHGFAKAQTARSMKSGAPDLLAPVSFAMRVRQILGVGARAEVVRILLTSEATTTVGVLTDGAAYARRNVQEALTALHHADVVSIVNAGREPRYAIDIVRWRALLGLDQQALPAYRDWPQLFAAARRIIRWLNSTDEHAVSEYLLGSAIRDLVDATRDDLAHAGISVGSTVGDVDAWALLDEVIDGLLAALTVDGPGAATPARISVVGAAGATWRWALHGAEQEVAVSAESFADHESATRGAAGFTRVAGRSRAEVFADGGGYGWRLRSPDGRVAAVSVQRFASAPAAQRAVDRHRPGVPVSLEVLASAGRGWDVVGPGERRALGGGRTQAEAVRFAEDLLAERGGGEVIVHGRDGRVVGRRTSVMRGGQ